MNKKSEPETRKDVSEELKEGLEIKQQKEQKLEKKLKRLFGDSPEKTLYITSAFNECQISGDFWSFTIGKKCGSSGASQQRIKAINKAFITYNYTSS